MSHEPLHGAWGHAAASRRRAAEGYGSVLPRSAGRAHAKRAADARAVRSVASRSSNPAARGGTLRGSAAPQWRVRAQGQRLERVSVYPSDFGLAQMAEEARAGPRALFGDAAPGGGGAAEDEAGAQPSGERNGPPPPRLRSAPAPACGSTHEPAAGAARMLTRSRASAAGGALPGSQRARACPSHYAGARLVRALVAVGQGPSAQGSSASCALPRPPPDLYAGAPRQGRALTRRARARARAAWTSGACSCTSAPSCATSTRWPSLAARRLPRTCTPSATAWSLSAARTSWTCASCRTGRALRAASRATWPPRCCPRSPAACQHAAI